MNLYEKSFASLILIFTLGHFCGCAEKNIVVKGKSQFGKDVLSGDLDKLALALLEAECYSCHGKEGANAGNMGNVLNISSMVEKKLIKFGDAKGSRLLQRMLDKKQPMPVAGLLPAEKIRIIEQWILSDTPYNRTPVVFEDVYKLISEDLEKQANKVDIRYFQMVNLYNSGAPNSLIQSTRMGLAKMLNMLSTAEKIVKLSPIDDKKLVYRVNLQDYDLHRPETMYTQMLKNQFPRMSNEQKDKWLPDLEERKIENFYGGRFKEVFEGKSSLSEFLKPGEHTFKDGLPFPQNPMLKEMALKMRESGQNPESTKELDWTKACQNPKSDYSDCSSPIPLMRADWFVSQVAANMRMRLYYHVSGMDDDTVTLDAALGIDDVEGFLYSPDPDFNPNNTDKEKIIRAGFNNSGVSINHRSIERIPLDYSAGRPLWRAYEFKEKSKFEFADIFDFAAGPFFEISAGGDPGYECITFMSPRYMMVGTQKVRTLRLLDLGLFYPSKMPDGRDPAIVTRLKNLKETNPLMDSDEANELLTEFEELYHHKDYMNYGAQAYKSAYGGKLPEIDAGELGKQNMIECEAPLATPTFRHESLEYFFLKKNGMPGFVNVGLKAEHLDYKVPNQRAMEGKNALLIPAYDKPETMVVAAPLSCLSCHAKGYIEKKDMVRDYVSQANYSEQVKKKIQYHHVPLDDLKNQMAKDNQVLRTAMSEAEVNIDEPEPIVETYRNWAIPGLNIVQVASELEITPKSLKKLMAEDPKVKKVLKELVIEGSVLKRSEFEHAYYDLMCWIHGSCKEVPKENIIPAQ